MRNCAFASQGSISLLFPLGTSSWTSSQDLDDIDREIQKLEEGKLILQQDIDSENWMKKRYQEQIEIAANQLKQIPPVDNARNSLTSSHATGEIEQKFGPDRILGFTKAGLTIGF